jgi:hypothetical protein
MRCTYSKEAVRVLSIARRKPHREGKVLSESYKYPRCYNVRWDDNKTITNIAKRFIRILSSGERA